MPRIPNAPTYSTGKPCPRGHENLRYLSNNSCCECQRQRVDSRDPEKKRTYNEQWRAQNAGKISEESYARYWSDPEKHRAYHRDYGNQHREKRAIRLASRRAKIQTAFVTLSDEENFRIYCIYAEAQQLSRETGIPHEVDHMMPLARGGLHHPDNLQVLTKTDNRRKNAKIPEGPIVPQPTEFQLQKAFTIYFKGEKWDAGPNKGQWKCQPNALPGVISWHTPNGGTRDVREGVNLKAIGVSAGVHDYLFLWDGGLFGLEFKRPGGPQPPEKQRSDAQERMHAAMLAAGMVASEVVDNLAAAKDFVRRHGLVIPGR